MRAAHNHLDTRGEERDGGEGEEEGVNSPPKRASPIYNREVGL